ncbi:SUR7/PalI family domain-containing protein [Trichoderma austrokoningii]
MLRPATPLSVLLGIAFALLLLSVISAPIISAIPLGSFDNVQFGVFGFCKPSGCSSAGIGYDIDSVVGNHKSQNFDLPSGVRHTLSMILILHPVAAFLTLVMFFMAVAAHFRSASHSSKYLLAFLIFNLITFLVCLAAFVIDVLLFIPHMAWGTYIVIAATALLFLSLLVSCAMRRTLISRKDQRRRIAENAEMNAQSYYNREEQEPKSAFVMTTQQPTVTTMISGGSGTQDTQDTLPAFATYETPRDDQISDEHIPLTQRTTSERSNNGVQQPMAADMAAAVPGTDFYNGPQRSASADPYGNYPNSNAYGDGNYPNNNAYGDGNFPNSNAYGDGNFPNSNAYGAAAGQPYDRMNRGPPTRQATDPSDGYRSGRGGRGGYGGPLRGRGGGGYGPPGRGGYGPRSGRGGGGGYGQPRGGYGYYNIPRGGGTRSPPPMDYSSDNVSQYNRLPQQLGYVDGQGGPYAGVQQAQSDPALNYPAPTRSASASDNGSSNKFVPYRPDLELPRAESPPPLPEPTESAVSSLGKAIEMDATPAAASSNSSNQYGNNLRDSDTDVAGMVNLQQGLKPSSPRRETFASDGSRYSQDERNMASRAAWNQAAGRSSPQVAPLAPLAPLTTARRRGGPTTDLSGTTAPVANTEAAGNYYEDVDPRFDQTAHTPPGRRTPPPPLRLQPTAEVDYEEMRAAAGGTRSPAESEHSNFTSISQRGINPQWNPPPMPTRRPVQQQQQRQDILLDNPDFKLPGGRSGTRKLPGMTPDSAYPGR